MYRTAPISHCLFIALVITGCASVKLLNSNKEFVSLMQQSAEATRLHDTAVLDAITYASAMEGLQSEFAANGDNAVKAAKAAKTDPAKASLLNVAVRSYLKSGGARDMQLLASADTGLDACSRLSDLDALPTTCGYFHIVIPQAVSNEWQRKTAIVKRKQATLANDEMLTAEDGKTLIASARGFLAQLTALENARPKIDFDNAGENLTLAFERQQNIFFCNAQSALISLRLVVETGVDWNKAQEERQAHELERAQKTKLKAREGGLPADVCNPR